MNRVAAPSKRISPAKKTKKSRPDAAERARRRAHKALEVARQAAVVASHTLPPPAIVLSSPPLHHAPAPAPAPALSLSRSRSPSPSAHDPSSAPDADSILQHASASPTPSLADSIPSAHIVPFDPTISADQALPLFHSSYKRAYVASFFAGFAAAPGSPNPFHAPTNDIGYAEKVTLRKLVATAEARGQYEGFAAGLEATHNASQLVLSNYGLQRDQPLSARDHSPASSASSVDSNGELDSNADFNEPAQSDLESEPDSESQLDLTSGSNDVLETATNTASPKPLELPEPLMSPGLAQLHAEIMGGIFDNSDSDSEDKKRPAVFIKGDWGLEVIE